MKNYALKRLLQLIPILLAITFLSYGMMRIAGSDVVEQKMENTSGTVSQEMIDNARAELGLDKPFVVAVLHVARQSAQGDMGTSYVSNKPVFSTFVSKLPATLLLTAVSILADRADLDPARDLVGGEAEHGDRLRDPHGELYRQLSAELFRLPAADVLFCDQARLVSGHLRRRQPAERGAARPDAGDRPCRPSICGRSAQPFWMS